MISFDQFAQNIVPFTLKYEGYYANVSGDKGGETYRGISRVHNPGWSGWATVDKLKPLKHNQNIPALEDNVIKFYWDNYFLPKGFQNLDRVPALALFDFAVNGGYSARKFKAAVIAKYKTVLSNSASISADDGKALSNIDSLKLAMLVQDLRAGHFTQILANNPSQAKFSSGWQSRLDSLNSELVSVIKRHPIRTAGILGLVVFAIVFFSQP